MSLWLKRQQPIQLYQGSEIPYVILENGVHLCFDNCYGVKPDHNEHNISFTIESSHLSRINTNFYKIASFPAVIPFSNIILLDDAILNGIVTNQTYCSGDSKSIAVIKPKYIRSLPDVSDFYDKMKIYDSSFILVGEKIDPNVRVFEDSATILHHKEWARDAVTIADQLCEQPDRKLCWSKFASDLSVYCYGINKNETDDINNAFDAIGISDISVSWVD